MGLTIPDFATIHIGWVLIGLFGTKSGVDKVRSWFGDKVRFWSLGKLVSMTFKGCEWEIIGEEWSCSLWEVICSLWSGKTDDEWDEGREPKVLFVLLDHDAGWKEGNTVRVDVVLGTSEVIREGSSNRERYGKLFSLKIPSLEVYNFPSAARHL